MNAKKTLTLATGLVLVLAATACKRHGIDQPSPVGPSTLATILKVSANPNVINAGLHRVGTTISASLKRFDGTPLADRIITFEICDANHVRVNIGYFEDQEGVLSKKTDSGGNIALTYYGPLNSDIEASTSVNIWATAAAEGSESIENFTPINIIRDASSFTVLLELSANPNVIFAGTQRQSSTIMAKVKKLDGVPLANRTVYFEIGDANHIRVNVGFFEGRKNVLSKQTDSGGNIALTYYGPLNSEIEASTSVNIWATAAAEGPESAEAFTPISIIRDTSSSAVLLELSANPNVIFAGAQRQGSTIMATVMRLDGTPLANRTVYFEIGDVNHNRVNIGFFEGQKGVLSKQTNSGGNITLTYYGPLNSEIEASTSVNIWATTTAEGSEPVVAFAPINIIRDTSSSIVVLEISADPNILNAGTQREHATIIATLKRLDGTPLANRTVYFDINDETDRRAHIGYFGGENPVSTQVTDSEGKATVIYFAPIKSEIGRSCVVHIWASTPGEGAPFIQKFVEILIIR